MSVLDERWHANEESGRIYDERGSCVADLCAPEGRRAAHLRFFMGVQGIARALKRAHEEIGSCDCSASGDCYIAAELRAAGVLDDVSETRGQ